MSRNITTNTHKADRILGQPDNLARFTVFDSLAQFSEAAQESASRTLADSDPTWAGGTFDEATNMATHGWEEPLPEVDALVDGMAKQLTLSPTLDVSGSDVDIDRYLSSEPECMLDYPLGEKDIRSISVLIPICFSSLVKATTARMRGIAVAAALEELHRQGITATVYAYLYITGTHGNKAVTLVKLADTRVAYDAARVAYGVGHPTMLRQLFFGYEDGWESQYHLMFGIESGRGAAPYSVTEGDDNIEEFLHRILDTEEAIDIPALHYNQNKWTMEQHLEQVQGFFTKG